MQLSSHLIQALLQDINRPDQDAMVLRLPPPSALKLVMDIIMVPTEDQQWFDKIVKKDNGQNMKTCFNNKEEIAMVCPCQYLLLGVWCIYWRCCCPPWAMVTHPPAYSRPRWLCYCTNKTNMINNKVLLLVLKVLDGSFYIRLPSCVTIPQSMVIEVGTRPNSFIFLKSESCCYFLLERAVS